MTIDPIPGLSDQRYFHVALLSPRRRDFRFDWIWNTVRKDCKLSQGRYGRTAFADGRVEFKTARESAIYAASSGAKEALATSDGLSECAYDVFGGAVEGLAILGSGYAGLTRVLVRRLVKRDLLSNAWFLVPKLHDIVDFCRAPQNSSLPAKFTITGFSAFVPGVKNLKLIRLGGADVFNSGLVEQIERWLRTRGREDAGDHHIKGASTHSLLYQGIRLKAVGVLSGSAVSLSLAADGGCKMWLRKSAINIPEFATAISSLKRESQFETSTEPPSWSEDLVEV